MAPFTTSFRFLVFLFFSTLLTAGLFSSAAQAQTVITVSSTADSGPGTLREAITTANSNTALTYLITLPASQTISLTAALPSILFSGTIAGGSTLCPATGVGGTTLARVEGGGEFQLLNLTGTNKVLEVADVSFLNGRLGNIAGASAGAIQVNTSNNLIVRRCLFRNNEGRSVGAILISGDLVVEDSYFENNRCTLSTGSSDITASNGVGIMRINRTAFRVVANVFGMNQRVINLT